MSHVSHLGGRMEVVNGELRMVKKEGAEAQRHRVAEGKYKDEVQRAKDENTNQQLGGYVQP